ncbi:unnamed protein product, partial [Nesidiocoris tenuis]
CRHCASQLRGAMSFASARLNGSVMPLRTRYRPAEERHVQHGNRPTIITIIVHGLRGRFTNCS